MTKLFRRLLILTLLSSLAIMATACGDLVGATGDQGLVNYSLRTNYDVELEDLRAVTLVTGHWQAIQIRLTSEGEREVGEATVDHRVVPSEGIEVTIAQAGDVPDLELRAATPGTYTLETLHGGEVLDSIELTFDAASAIQINPKVRAPWSESWISVTEGELTTIDEGTEVSFVPEPVDASGRQLVGNMDLEATFDPAWAIVPGSNLQGLYSNGWWRLQGPATFFVIEPPDDGTLTMTLRDAGDGLQATHTFLVTPVDTE